MREFAIVSDRIDAKIKDATISPLVSFMDRLSQPPQPCGLCGLHEPMQNKTLPIILFCVNGAVPLFVSLGSKMGAPNKPANTLFKQQRLPAWQPILSPPHVTACFVVIALVFIPIGIALVVANNNAFDLEYKYSNIKTCTPNNNEAVYSYTVDGSTTTQGCRVNVAFTLSETIPAPVYMYYKLTNFYQNHRRYAKSRSDSQLRGTDVSASSLSDADPLAVPGDYFGSTGVSLSVNGNNRTYNDFVYNPAGLVAWSMFNDTFALYRVEGGVRTLLCNSTLFDVSTNQPTANMSCKKAGIAWDSDVSSKYKSPYLSDSQWTAKRSLFGAQDVISNNPFLDNGWYANESGHRVPLAQDEDFMVWMRTSSLPSFRKLFRIFTEDLPAGQYEMEIIDLFDVSSFDGEKAFALATVTWAGGKNKFLAVAYIVVGAVVLVAGIVFMIVHRVCGDRSQKAIEDLMNELK